jgi:hypothetical protein
MNRRIQDHTKQKFFVVGEVRCNIRKEKNQSSGVEGLL